MMYPKLALDGIRKNRRLYVPYLLTCFGMVFLYFIIAALSDSPVVAQIRGAESTQILLTVGKGVIAIFAAIFLFYTGSFLTRRRRKEFGLYNILGMNKCNIACILAWETLIAAVLSLVSGIALGLLLYKLAELALVRVMGGEAVYQIRIVWNVLPETAAVFCCIYCLQFFVNILRLRRSSAITLLRSENTGEKPPRANFLLALFGLLFLGMGYAIAVTMENPFQAMSWFFPAVALVIIGTYLMFIAVSVVMCRILQKNKRYYYDRRHFVSVANMAYRMKRNGAGLASICILATMVLVMMSSAACLLIGEEDILLHSYPKDFYLSLGFEDSGITSAEEAELLTLMTDGIEPESVQVLRSVKAMAARADDSFCFSGGDFPTQELSSIYELTFIDEAGYAELTGQTVSLAEDRVLLGLSDKDTMPQSLTIQHMGRFEALPPPYGRLLDEFFMSTTLVSYIKPAVIVVHDLSQCDALLEHNGDENLAIVYAAWECRFDSAADRDEQTKHYERIRPQTGSLIFDIGQAHEGSYTYEMLSKEDARRDFYALFGAIFFLAVLLSIMFLLGTVLIIYYKQITEGYEDMSRFEIMQKVGMTGRDIRRSVNSQMLTVFFMPLLLAALHVTFAFPILRKILMMFSMNNLPLFAATTFGCFLIFAIIYTLVYRVTSNAYCAIVSVRGE